MKSLRTYINEDESKLARFMRLKQGKSKEEIRKLEMELLRPEKLQMRVGAKMRAVTTLEARSILLVFPTDTSVDLFKKYFKVSKYKGQSAHRIEMLIDFLQVINTGELVYDANKHTFART